MPENDAPKVKHYEATAEVDQSYIKLEIGFQEEGLDAEVFECHSHKIFHINANSRCRITK